MINLDQILTERLAILGGTGSGKSFTARGLVERILAAKGRVGIIDPTGVWWGLRLGPNGKKPSGHDVVVFGGDRGDVPLVETGGRVVAQAVAGSSQSWIVDTSALKTKAAERRFMTEFLDGLFEFNRADITLVVDEADRFSPQRMSPETTRLHERMEEIVRRGRVRGFTAWLITQRPASLNKDVLSMATAYICMRMTGAHDRKAIADALEGQGDKPTVKAIVDAMPRHKTGSGMVWAPQRDILAPVGFPAIETFDSMRPLSATEKHATEKLPLIDIGALREKLVTVEVEAKANDPKVLRAEIAALKKTLAQSAHVSLNKPIVAVPDEKAMKAEYERGYGAGVKWAYDTVLARDSDTTSRLRHLSGELDALARAVAIPFPKPKDIKAPAPVRVSTFAETKTGFPKDHPIQKLPNPDGSRNPNALPAALQKVINAIGWWRQIGKDPVERSRACVVAGYSPKASTFGVYIADLVKRGLVVAERGTVALTPEGVFLSVVPTGETHEQIRTVARGLLGPQEQRVFDVVYEAYPNEIARNEVAERVGLSPTASTNGVYLAGVAAYGIIEPGSRGHVKAADWLFP